MWVIKRVRFTLCYYVVKYKAKKKNIYIYNKKLLVHNAESYIGINFPNVEHLLDVCI